jgi:hypothetical protein
MTRQLNVRINQALIGELEERNGLWTFGSSLE